MDECAEYTLSICSFYLGFSLGALALNEFVPFSAIRWVRTVTRHLFTREIVSRIIFLRDKKSWVFAHSYSSDVAKYSTSVCSVVE